MAASLFTVPVAGSDGTVTVTSPQPKVYLLTFVSPPDNRLTAEFCSAFILALDILEAKYENGVLITTSGIPKFFSNGLDLNKVIATPGFFPSYIYPLFRRLMTFSMPTIALINGHCFAGGLLLAVQHDYRIMNPSKGYLCMNEVDFGAVIDSPLLTTMRAKFASAIPHVFRSLILEGKRFTSQEGAAVGLIDGTGGLDEVLKLIKEKNLVEKGAAGVYGPLREGMWPGAIQELTAGGHEAGVAWRRGMDEANLIVKRQGAVRIEKWEKLGGVAQKASKL